MSLLNSFDTDANIWEIEPQLKIPQAFNKLYSEDTSKSKAHSSKIMWAIALLVDNSEANKFRNLTFDDRQQLIAEDYLQDAKFDWSKYDEIKEAYEELSMSKLEKSLLIYIQKLEQRNKFVKDQVYTMDNASDLDKMITSTKGLFELISKLSDQVKQEKDSGTTKAGLQESGMESGAFN